MDSRQQTPELLRRVIFAATETRSFARASVALHEIAGHRVSAKTIERLTLQVGRELQVDEGSSLQPIDNVPELAVIQIDGGRIRVRRPGHGPGIHDPVWRESKTACLLRMSSQTFEQDPHPALPQAYRCSAHVAEIAGKAAPEVSSAPRRRGRSSDWRPRRLVRTCVASLAPANEFEQLVEKEAKQRRFQEAPRRAYLGDGLAYNWSIHRRKFSEYEPILDFIHVLQYVYEAAVAVEPEVDSSWPLYLRLAEACWQGRVSDVIEELTAWLSSQDDAKQDQLPDDDPRVVVKKVRNYLRNNQARMNYPHYRCQGLPVTSAHAESLIKEINWRVKGTEMFWNEPDGAEAILRLRAATLSEDGRLQNYLRQRQGSQYVRRTSLAA